MTTEEYRKDLARQLLKDEISFQELSDWELRCLYGEENTHYVIPNTACCAREEAQHILGEEETTRIYIALLKDRH